MDLSALIFVALAVAWAVYLIPKALKHHDEVVRSRSVEKFSHTMRVLARREPVDRRSARLVVAPIRAVLRPPVEIKAHPAPAPAPVASPSRPVTPQAARAAARRAAKRRRNVLALVLLANAVVIALAATSVVRWAWVGIPAAVLVAWLVACRLSVRAERSTHGSRAAHVTEVDADLTGELAPVPADDVYDPAAEDEAAAVAASPAAEPPAVTTGEVPVVTATVAGGWDMVPTTLPTYVSKPAARRRTVSTIDLESTGVWSSGRSDLDSALAREAEQADRSARETDREAEETRRANGA